MPSGRESKFESLFMCAFEFSAEDITSPRFLCASRVIDQPSYRLSVWKEKIICIEDHPRQRARRDERMSRERVVDDLLLQGHR